LLHGLPQRKLALFRVDAGSYEKIDESKWSKLDMEVHEHPIIKGAIGEILSPVRHEDDRGIRQFLDRHLDYADWEVHRLISLEHSQRWEDLTFRQSFKYKHVKKWWYCFFYFLYSYVMRLGFLDGYSGFCYALYKMWYFLTIRLLYLEQVTSNSTRSPVRF
jgi:hypothetical protein